MIKDIIKNIAKDKDMLIMGVEIDYTKSILEFVPYGSTFLKVFKNDVENFSAFKCTSDINYVDFLVGRNKKYCEIVEYISIRKRFLSYDNWLCIGFFYDYESKDRLDLNHLFFEYDLRENGMFENLKLEKNEQIYSNIIPKLEKNQFYLIYELGDECDGKVKKTLEDTIKSLEISFKKINLHPKMKKSEKNL